MTEAVEKAGRTTGGKGIGINFEEITFGPEGKFKRMIWLTTSKETSVLLGRMKNELKKNLGEKGIGCEEKEREFDGHVTLARFLPAAPTELPDVRQSVLFRFRAGKMYLTESHLSRSGAEYEDLMEVDL